MRLTALDTNAANLPGIILAAFKISFVRVDESAPTGFYATMEHAVVFRFETAY